MSFYNSFEEIFQEMKKRLTLTPTAMKLWIEPLKPLKLNNNHVMLYVESQFSKDMTMANFKTVMEEAFSDLLGFDVEVEILCSEDLTVEQKLKYGIESYADSSPKELQKELDDDDIVKTRLKNSELASNYQHTFDTFIVGDNNKLAYAACKAVVQEPSTRYNPLYIYSEPGLGKTHLLSAVKSEMEKLHPDMNIIYTTADTFTDDYVSNLRTKSNLEAFKQKYRSCDLLLIDDIQFIGGKERMEEEFFHTFNSLIENGKQIVLTSDRPPKEIQSLTERLCTRFEMGILADIQSPEYETRCAIIKNKAVLLNLSISNEVVEYIAEKIKTNIRQLEGTVKRLSALNELTNREPSIALAQKVIKDVIDDDIPPIPVTVERIIEEVSRMQGVPAEEIKSTRQKANISLARKMCMYIMREVTTLTLEQIGEEFGKNYSTVIYSLKEISKKKEEDSKIERKINDIINNVKTNS